MRTAASLRGPMILGALVIALLLGGLVGWGMFTKISGAVVASGRIDPERNQHIVQHLQGGVIDEILVKEGDTVERGQTLFRLDGGDRHNRLAIIENELLENTARTARLEAERDGAESLRFASGLAGAAAAQDGGTGVLHGERALFHARKDTMHREIEELERVSEQILRQIEGIDAQIAAETTQIALLAEDVAALRDLLGRGLTQASRVREIERQHTQHLGAQGELTAGRAAAAERLSQNRIATLGIATRRREEAITELRDLRLRGFELRERRVALLREIELLEIRAPVVGVVHALVVANERSVIRAAQPLLHIVPQDRPRVVTVGIEPSQAEHVHASQDATVRLSAFDAATVPELAGRVVRISADTLTEERTGRVYYEVEIHLPDAEIARLPASARLRPGMPVTVFIRTRDRTPMDYLLSPVARYFSRALREG